MVTRLEEHNKMKKQVKKKPKPFAKLDQQGKTISLKDLLKTLKAI